MRNSCVQAVYWLRIITDDLVHLYAAQKDCHDSPVDVTRTYALVTPTFVLGTIHRNVIRFTSVADRLMLCIHSTNKDHDKINLLITHRELCT